MQNPQPMTREELIELSEADALGMLDEYDAALYTRSFHHAAISVQDEIRDLQEVQVLNPHLLSDEEPDPSLGPRTVGRVSSAIEEENSELAPLATIGRGRLELDRGEPRLVLTRSWQFWRAACFVLLASLLAVLYFYVDAVRYSQKVTSLALDRLAEEDLRRLVGPSVVEFAGNPACDVIALIPTAGQSNCSGLLYVNRNTGSLFIVALEVPAQAGELSVALKMESGETISIGRMVAKSGLSGVRFDGVDPTLLASATGWSITDGAGRVLLQSA